MNKECSGNYIHAEAGDKSLYMTRLGINMLASGQGWAVSRAGLSIQRSHTEQCTGCVEWVSAEGAQAQGILAEVIELQLSSGGHRDTLPMRPHLLRSSGAKAWGQTGPGNDAQSSQFNSKSPL